MKIAAILLAAGASKRFGEADKLTADLDGEPILKKAIKAFDKAALSRRIAVTAPGGAAEALLRAHGGFEIVVNERACDGMGGSLSAGAAALSDEDGAMIVLGDMPFIAPATFDRAIDAFTKSDGAKIVAPDHHGQRGHPVIFPRTYFAALTRLTTDSGAGGIIARHKNDFAVFASDDPGVLRDIDRPEDLTQV
ncbi:MAG: nucleotidyltransferase family protein [Pseudomonadota bacterium]